MNKKLGVIAVICFAFALCAALVACGGVNKAAYTGTWQLESGSDESLNSESIQLMKSLGLEVTLTLNEDGTGSLDLFGENTAIKWEAKSDSEGTLSINDTTASLKLADGKLTLEDASGSSMTFIKGEATSSSATAGSAAAASSEAAASGEAAASDEAAASGEAASSNEAASAEAAEASSSAAAA